MAQLKIIIHSLVDVDVDEGSLPYIQLTCEGAGGEGVKTTGTGKKTSEGYIFQQNNEVIYPLAKRLNSLTFQVKVYMKGKDFLSCYDGIGKISNLSGTGEDHSTCYLYDNGDEDIPFGEILYSWSVEKSQSSVINDLDATYNRLREGMSSDFSETSERPSKQIKNPPNLTLSLGEDEPFDLFEDHRDDYEDEDVDEDRPVSSPAPPPLQFTQSPNASTKNGIIDVPNKKPVKKARRPEWTQNIEYSPVLGNAISQDILNTKTENLSFTVKIHTVMYSPHNISRPASPLPSENSPPASAQLKVSIQPLPGRAQAIRTKLCSVTDGINSPGYTFDFEMQTASVQMSIADLKSPAYRQGVCPTLTMEFSTGKFTSVGSLYLPQLLQETPGKLILLNTICPCASVEMVEGKATILFEIVAINKSLTQATVMSTPLKSPSPNSKVQPSTIPHPISSTPCDITLELIGLTGKGLKEIESCFIEASLTCSGVSDHTEPKYPLRKKIFEFNFHTHFCSNSPHFDVVQLKILANKKDHQDFECVGMVSIPLSILQQNEWVLEGSFQAYRIQPPLPRGFNRIDFQPIGLTIKLSSQLDHRSSSAALDLQLPNAQESEEERDFKLIDLDQGTTPTLHAESNQLRPRYFEPVKSVSGNLTVCAHGFIPRVGGTCTFSNLDLLSIEFCIPNSSSAILDKSEVVRMTRYNDDPEINDERYCALWDKEFKIPVVWSLQQRYVGYLLGTIYRSVSKTKTNDSDTRKHILGYVSLDLSSLVTMNDDPLVASLPVFHAVSGSLEDYQDCFGYIMLGLHFLISITEKPSRCLVPKMTEPPVLRPKQSIAWEQNEILSEKKPPTILSQKNNSNSTFGKLSTNSTLSSLRKLCIERWKEFCDDLLHQVDQMAEDIVPVSVSFSDIEAIAGPLRQINQTESISLFVSSNHDPMNSEGYVNPENGKISLESPDFNVQMTLRSNLSIILLFKLIRNSENEVLGSATLILPRELVITGKPMNIAIPMRNSEGLKVAVATCGCHFSSYSLTSAIKSYDNQTSGQSDYNLQVTIAEGNISDGEWTPVLEPYFECSLINSTIENGPANLRRGSVPLATGRTISVDSSAGQWGVVCQLPIPLKVFEKSADAQFWNLLVQCRDSLRLSHPILAQTQVSLPYSLLQKDQPFDQWVRLDDMTTLTNNTSVLQANEEEPPPTTISESRLRIKITRVNRTNLIHYANDMNPIRFPGVGQVIIWYHSIREGDNVTEKLSTSQDIISSEVNVELISGGNENYIDHLEEDSTALLFRHYNIESRRSIYIDNELANVLSGHIEIPGGKSLINLRIISSTERVPLLTSISTMATLPKPLLNPATNLAQITIDVPIQEVILRPEQINKRTSISKQRLARLKVGTVYVPYLTGYLYILHSDLIIHDTVAERFQLNPVKKGVFRFSLGGLGNCFTPVFSMSLHSAKEKDDQTCCSSVSSKTGYQKPTEPTVTSKSRSFKRNLTIRTPNNNSIEATKSKANKLRKLVASTKRSPSPRLLKESRKSNEPSIPSIEINTFDIFMNSYKNQSTDIFCLKVCLYDIDLVGRQYCLGIGYLQTAAIYYQSLRLLFSTLSSSSSMDLKEIPSTIDADVDLFDPTRHIQVATVTIKMKFEITSIPTLIINYLKSCKQYYHSLRKIDSLYGRAELGLKQAYQLADQNNSGGISATELLTVIENLAKYNQRTLSSVKSTPSEIIGFDENIKTLLLLLMSLVNQGAGKIELDDGEMTVYSKERVMKLFQAMDLDGDGNISWWEWRQVLENTSIVSLIQQVSETTQYHIPLDFLDPLLITLEAAHGYLISVNGGIIISKPREYSTIRIANEDSNEKLQTEINALKYKNKTLQSKLYQAINSSQSDAHETEARSPSREQTNQMKEMFKLLEIEKNRRIELENEMERLQRNSNEMKKSQSEVSLENQNRKQKLLVEAERLRLEMILTFMERKKYENAKNILKRFLIRLKQMINEKKLRAEQEKLNKMINNLLIRKSYQMAQRKRFESAVVIQTQIRKYLGKKRVQNIKEKGKKIHELVEMRKKRKEAQLILKVLKKMNQMRRNYNAIKIQRMYRSHRRRKYAAQLIQSMYRGFKLRNMLFLLNISARRIQTFYRSYIQQREYRKIQQKISILQKIYRGHHGREHYKKLKCDKNRKEYENEMARLIQRMWRGYKYRKEYNDMKESAKVLQKLLNKNLKNKRYLRDKEEQERRERERKQKEENERDDLMILRRVDQRPPREQVVGYWVGKKSNHPDSDRVIADEEEGLVIYLDQNADLLTVSYLEDISPESPYNPQQSREEFLNYEDDNLIWYVMLSAKEERKQIHAASKIQAAVRGWKTRKAFRNVVLQKLSRAATKIQALYRGRLAKRIAQTMTNGDACDVELHATERPPIENSIGYWIVRDDETDREGIIEKYNLRQRILYVNFQQLEGNIFRTNVPYDEPNLLWFKEVATKHLSQEEAALRIQALARGRNGRNLFHELKAGNSRDVSQSLSTVGDGESVVDVLDTPPPIERAAGYWVSQSNSKENGLVDRVILKERKLIVLFEGEDDELLKREISYDEPGLVWMK